MKKHTTVVILGALLTLVLTVNSFAEAAGHVRHHPRTHSANTYSGYYDSTVGSYGYDGFGGYNHESFGGYGNINSGAMGSIGR